MGVDLDLDQKLGEISVGKQQLVAIARAITFDAKVIVMDEPTAALSSSEVKMLYRIIDTLKERGVSIIYISHKLEEVFTVADRITVLRDGFKIHTDDAKNFTNESLINMMVGRELRFIPMRNEEGESDEVLFEVKNLVNPPMVNGVSFKVFKNEVLGITGLVGAGRSETAQTIFGLMKQQEGTMYIHGEEIKVKDTNDYSIVIRLDYGETSFVFTGDATMESEALMLDANPASAFKCDVLKIGHHGSHTSTSEAFLKACAPSMAIISCGEGNSYGHPHDVILDRLEKAGIPFLRTDKQGTIIFVSDKNEVNRLTKK
jgi:ABC-type Mn2+/Zn2+ transport system ATPase subunit